MYQSGYSRYLLGESCEAEFDNDFSMPLRLGQQTSGRNHATIEFKMSNIKLPEKLARNPITQKAHARQTLWQITVPLVIGMLMAITLAVLAGLGGADDASRWADISLIFLIIPAMLATLLFVMLFAALNYGLLRVLKYLPPVTRRVQDIFSQAEQRVRTGADMAAEPILRIHGVLAAARSLRQQLRFRR